MGVSIVPGRSMRMYFFFPLALLFAAFLLDKQLYIGGFEDYFLRTASFLNYDHKEELLDEVKAQAALPDRKKIMIMFGNSRTMTFDNAYIQSKYPDWILYNFSVPGGTSDYYYYFMTQFRKRGIHPDYIFFAVSPQGFNATPAIAMDEVMLNGLPVSFIGANFTHYSADDLSNYAAKKLFWNYQFRPKLSTILERYENHGAGVHAFRRFISATHVLLIDHRGSVPPAERRAVQNDDFLTLSAKGTWKDFLSPFSVSPHQMYFTDQMLRICEEMKIPAFLVWAKVGGQLREMKNHEVIGQDAAGKPMTIRSVWEPAVETLARNRSSDLLDMNYGPSIKCDLFYDASHMAAECFQEFTDYLFASMKRPRP